MSDSEKRSVREILAGIEAKLEASEKASLGYHTDIKERLNNHGGRIGSLERWRWLTTGGGIVVGSVVGFWAKITGGGLHGR